MIHLENKVLAQLEHYGVNAEMARKYLEANKHNHITTTYYLLLRKHKLQPIKESMDAPRPPTRTVVPKLPIEAIKKVENSKLIDPRVTQTPKNPTARSPIRNNYESFSPRPSVPSKSSRNSVSPNRAPEGLKSYSGPYNVECISAKIPFEICKNLENTLDKLRIL